MTAGSPSRLPSYAAKLLRKEIKNQRALTRARKLAQPDLIYIWNMAQISISIAARAERSGLPVCYFISDRWLTRWRADPWHQLWTTRFSNPLVRAGHRIFGSALSALGFVTSSSLALPHVHFVSNYLRRDLALDGAQPKRSEIIPWGIDLEQFQFRVERNQAARLLYVGQVTALKGFRTAIEAMRLLVKEQGYSQLTLTVAGGSITPDFMAEMRDLVRSYGLGEYVEFVGFVSHESLADVYQCHDILIFPSLFEEALTITTLEAMACGLAVVSTATGGNPEVMRDGYNALTFLKEDAEACAGHIRRLVNDSALFMQLRMNGRRTVEEGFEIEGMIDKLECSLRRQVESGLGYA